MEILVLGSAPTARLLPHKACSCGVSFEVVRKSMINESTEACGQSFIQKLSSCLDFLLKTSCIIYI